MNRPLGSKTGDQLLYGIVAGLSFAAILALFFKTELDNSASFALCCFALALPLAAATFLAVRWLPGYPQASLSVIFMVAGIASGVSCLIGIAAILFSVWSASLWVFVLSVIVAVIAHSVVINKEVPAEYPQQGGRAPGPQGY